MKLSMKNSQTGKSETIVCRECTEKDWGFSFFVDSEIEAYKAAYQYRNFKHGVKVEFAGGCGEWMVTVFNEFAASIGLDGATV